MVKRKASWTFVVDYGVEVDSGKRRQIRRSGFRTRKDAKAALHTGRQLWNKQRRDEVLIDVDDVAYSVTNPRCVGTTATTGPGPTITPTTHASAWISSNVPPMSSPPGKEPLRECDTGICSPDSCAARSVTARCKHRRTTTGANQSRDPCAGHRHSATQVCRDYLSSCSIDAF